MASSRSMVALGSTGLEVSPMGFGAMGITAFYGPPMEDEAAVALLTRVYNTGFTHFDTAEVYQGKTAEGVQKYNEEQLGNFLRTLPRQSFTVATKFLPQVHGGKCDLATVTAAVDASLAKLGLQYVDLYYCHRMPATLEDAEEWMRSMKAIVASGKVKHVGLSEVGMDWLRRMHAIHPVACVQQEWSLLTRNLEDTVLPVYKELGIGVVAYSPLARNLLGGAQEALGKDDWRSDQPRYNPENLAKNQDLVRQIAALGQERGKTPAQLSLAWLYHRARSLGVTVVPIPGTTKAERAAENWASLDAQLTDSEMAQLETLGSLVAGARGNESYQNMSLEGQMRLK
jgi:aryl-alcohol dehydrogenase-like predicted oxidoreductase